MSSPNTLLRASRSALLSLRSPSAALSARALLRSSPSAVCPILSSSFHSSSLLLKKGGKSDKGNNKKQKAAAIEDEFEEEEVSWEGKGKKGKGKGKLVSGHGREVEEEVGNKQVSLYDLAGYEAQMEDAVERMRVGFKTVVGRVGRVSPGQWRTSCHAGYRAGRVRRRFGCGWMS